VAAAIGALSARTGLLLVLGYAAGDYLIAGPRIGPTPVAVPPFTWLNNPLISNAVVQRVPQLLMYLLLALLTVIPTLATGMLVRSLSDWALAIWGLTTRRIVRADLTARIQTLDRRVAGVARVLPWVVRVALVCAVDGYLVSAWTAFAPMAFRIPWLWAAQPPPIPVIVFLNVTGSWVWGAAVLGMALRLVLVVRVGRRRDVQERAARQDAALVRVDAARNVAWPRRLPASVRALLAAGCIALLLSGFASSPAVDLAVFGGLAALLVLWRSVLPRLQAWRRWTHVAGSVPPAARLLVVVVLLPVVAGWYYAVAPWATLVANQAAGSFGAQLTMMSVGLVLLIVLFPRADGVHDGEGHVWPVGAPTRWRRARRSRLATGALALLILGFVWSDPGRADAACLDPHCCFVTDDIATWVTIASLVLLFVPGLGEADMAAWALRGATIGDEGAFVGAARGVAGVARTGWDGLVRLFSRSAEEDAARAVGDVTPEMATVDTGATTDASAASAADGGGGAGTGGPPDAAPAPDDGPGSWESATESMPDRAAQYQSQVTGSPPGQVYRLNGVKFDGYRDGTLLETKGPGYATFVQSTGRFYTWFRGQSSLIDQASRQLLAARGTPIVWHVAEESAAVAIRRLLAQNGLGAIKVIFTAAAH